MAGTLVTKWPRIGEEIRRGIPSQAQIPIATDAEAGEPKNSYEIGQSDAWLHGGRQRLPAEHEGQNDIGGKDEDSAQFQHPGNGERLPGE